MQIKEIAKLFAKAGVNARPKAINTVRDCIEEINQASKQAKGDVEMEDENDMKVSNDGLTEDYSQEVIKFIIKRFNELKDYGGASSSFLEVDTVKQIFQTFRLKDLDTPMPKAKAQNGRGFMGMIKETEDKIMEDKCREIDDPNHTVLQKKVIVLDSFVDLPTPRLLGTNVVYKVNGSKSLICEANSRTNYFQARMKILEEQILKGDRFERAKLKHSEMQFESNTTCLNRINSLLGSSGKV